MALKFHELRQKSPELCKSSFGNKVMYGKLGF